MLFLSLANTVFHTEHVKNADLYSDIRWIDNMQLALTPLIHEKEPVGIFTVRYLYEYIRQNIFSFSNLFFTNKKLMVKTNVI